MVSPQTILGPSLALDAESLEALPERLGSFMSLATAPPKTFLDKIRGMMRRNRRGQGWSGSFPFLTKALKTDEAGNVTLTIPTAFYSYYGEALDKKTPLLRSIFGTEIVQVYNTASAGLVMGILILPLITSMSEDALNAVPRSLRGSPSEFSTRGTGESAISVAETVRSISMESTVR